MALTGGGFDITTYIKIYLYISIYIFFYVAVFRLPSMIGSFHTYVGHHEMEYSLFSCVLLLLFFFIASLIVLPSHIYLYKSIKIYLYKSYA